MNPSSIPNRVLSNGQSMPVIGFGTFKAFNDDNNQLSNAIKEAIRIGYRHFDCAFLIYRNELIVGKAIREAIEESNGALKREDLFIVSKVWNTHHSKEKVRKNCESALVNLGIDYLDGLLCHWPMGYAEDTDKEPIPMDDNGKIMFSDIHYLETYHVSSSLFLLLLRRIFL